MTWLALALSALGWRGDGTGVVASATPPTRWSTTENLCWSAPLPAWSNASPVALGDLICVMSEPTTVRCHAAADGKLRWSATNDHADTLSPSMRLAHEAQRDYVLALEAQLTVDQAEFSRLQREVRRGASDAAPTLSALSERIQSARATIATFDRFRTDRPRSIMGWSTETPVTDGTSLFVLTGNGVLSRFERDGARTWTQQLPDAVGAMRGFSTGTAASPLLVDGTLITAWGHLRGHDPATGKVRWIGPTWTDYGTPAVARVDGVGWLVLPTGQVLRATDGRAGASQLGDQWFVGPAAVGDKVWFAGGRSRDDNARSGGITLTAWQVAAKPDGVQPTRRWATPISTPGAWYTAPLLHAGDLWVASDGGQLLRVDDATGAVRSTTDLSPLLGTGTVYPSPTLAGGRLYISADNGQTVVLNPADPATPVGGGVLEPGRATPLFLGSRIYVRGDKRLWCVGR
jgi:hypothetical protein